MTNNTLPQSPVGVAEQIAYVNELRSRSLTIQEQDMWDAILLSLNLTQAAELDILRLDWLEEAVVTTVHKHYDIYSFYKPKDVSSLRETADAGLKYRKVSS